MVETDDETFVGYEHNEYQNNMHSLATISLWLIIILGVAAGAYGFFWGLSK